MPKGPLIAAAELQPGQQQHRSAGQGCQGQRLGHHQPIRISLGMQGFKRLGLHLKQGHGLGVAALGEEPFAIRQRQTPGLVDAAAPTACTSTSWRPGSGPVDATSSCRS